jgi:hypothetical protein
MTYSLPQRDPGTDDELSERHENGIDETLPKSFKRE